MNSFANLSSRVRRSESERGAILVLTALVMLLLLFIAAFATDLGAWYRQGEEQQRAADVGSLNGIAAYDRGSKEFFAANGASGWGDLDPALHTAAEEAGLLDAVDTIQALLETSGMSFTTAPSITLADPPTDPFTESVVTLTADDGSVVTVTRSFVNTSDDPANPIYTRVIDVTISRSGEQYFSDIIRDAPTIDRTAQSLLSNCGAECTRGIEINPPFVGFEGNGNGDGYGPLLFDKDPTTQGIEEVWAVNHHSSGTGNGQIICMEVEEQAPCGSPLALNFQTGNRPVEYISPAGKIFYAARNQNTDRTGLACFDAATRSECAIDFVPLFDQDTAPNYPGWINVSGPFAYDGRLYVVSQDGQIGCLTEGMAPCGPNLTQELSTFGDARMPDLENDDFYISNGEQIGSTLYLTQNAPNGVFFHCLNLSAGNGTVTDCSGTAPVFNNTLGNGGDDNETFFSHDTAGNPNGICVLHILTMNNGCVSLSGWNDTGEITGMRDGLDRLSTGRWGGDAFTWNGKRTFFAGGNSNYVGCWNWETQAACTDGPDGGGAYLLADADYTGFGKPANPYGFAQVSDRCIIGLGHKAVFYSFNPEGFGSCVDATLSTQIFPCECQDGSGNRYGEVRLPPALLGLVDEIYATVSLTEGGPGLTGLDYIPLHENGGVIDLTGVDQTAPHLWLAIDVNAKLGDDGNPIWQDTFNADLQIDVQPTLTN